MEQLAHNEAGYEGFSQLLADLVFVPGMREPVMEAYARLKRLNSTKPFLLTICNSAQYARWADFWSIAESTVERWTVTPRWMQTSATG